MCIIVHKPAGVVLPDAVYQNCFEENRDGAGFSFVANGKVEIRKGFFTIEDLLKALEPHAQSNLVVHFRWATHGDKNEFNCHPWAAASTIKEHPFTFAIHHNGVLQHRSTKEMSDTGHFVQDILGPMLARDPWFLDFEHGIDMLGSYIGTGNKFAVHRSDGKVYLVNERAGVRDLGCWFSNRGYQESRRVFISNWDREFTGHIRREFKSSKSSSRKVVPLDKERPVGKAPLPQVRLSDDLTDRMWNKFDKLLEEYEWFQYGDLGLADDLEAEFIEAFRARFPQYSELHYESLVESAVKEGAEWLYEGDSLTKATPAERDDI